jgi:hypothetical protein
MIDDWFAERWQRFDDSYVAFCAGDGNDAAVMDCIEALVDSHWDAGVVDTLEEREEDLPGIASAIESCWWSPKVPEELIERMNAIARRDRRRAANALRSKQRRRYP